MPYTQLSPIATPGRRYSFSGKGGGPHIGGPFTQLSLIGTPGQRYAFTAKTVPEEPAAAVSAPKEPGGGERLYFGPKVKVDSEDDLEILEILQVIIGMN
jgi:hypothetical protein